MDSVYIYADDRQVLGVPATSHYTDVAIYGDQWDDMKKSSSVVISIHGEEEKELVFSPGRLDPTRHRFLNEYLEHLGYFEIRTLEVLLGRVAQ